MGVTNLDNSQSSEHVKNIAEFAVAAIETAGKIMIDEENPAKGFVRIRCGFHSGKRRQNVSFQQNSEITLALIFSCCLHGYP